MAAKLPRPTRDQLSRWRCVEGKTIPQIAAEHGVSESTVKNWVRELDVFTNDSYPAGRRPLGKKKSIQKGKLTIPSRSADSAFDPEEGLSRMEIAKLRLDGRWEEKRGNYYLDGQYVTTAQLLKAAGVGEP